MRGELVMQEESQPCLNVPELDNECKQYRPSRTEILKSYEINIRFHSSGCVINVGCKSVAFSDIKEGMEALNNYVSNPYENQKLWEEKFNKEQ